MERKGGCGMNLAVSTAPKVVGRHGVHHVPERVRSLCTFDAPDYIDSFTLHTPVAQERSAEGWARAVLEEAAVSRRSARRLWQAIGLRLGPRPYSAAYIQGWAIAANGNDWLRLETQSWYLSAQAVCLVDDEGISLSLSLRYDNGPVGKFVWTFVEGPHQRAVPIMLRQAAALVAN
jgi:hypothetical protein